MKKVIVLNRVEATIPTTCCNLFKKVDEFDHRSSEKLYLENEISNKFNEKSEGFKFEDAKVFNHDLYVENSFIKKGNHGVYRFENSDKKSNYKFYFGPFIKVDEKQLGCGNLGCKTGGLGCKTGSIGCKGLGCKDKGGDNKQHLNFMDNIQNESEVQILNEHFSLRKEYDEKVHDYLYDQKDSIIVSLSEYVKDNYNIINEQFEKDLNDIYSQGLFFDSLIDIPSYTEMFSQGMIFSSNGKDKITLANSALEAKGFSLYLKRLDLWYFPKVKGLMTQILEILYLIPIIGWILKFLFGSDEKKIYGTDIINEKNLQRLEEVYQENFNYQEEKESQFKQDLDYLKSVFVSKVPVTIAVKIKMSWWSKLWNGQLYTFYSYYANGVKK